MRRSGLQRGAAAHHRLTRLLLAGAVTAAGAATGQTLEPARQGQALPATAAAAPPAAVPAPVPDTLPAELDQRGFLQILTLRNADIRYSRLGAQAAAYARDAEAAMYEPVVFATVRQEGRERQRTFEERLQNLQTSSTEVLDEQVQVRELGVRSRLPSGGELSATYRMTDRENNLIALSRNSNEYTGGLVLSFKQPLMRGRGRDITETDRRIAELEHVLAVSQLQQQMQKVGADGLAVYWQVYKAQETVRYREESQRNTQRLIEDTRQRIAGGRVPAAALLDLRSVLLTRESELLRARQALAEAQVKLLTTLNLPATRQDATALRPQWSAPLPADRVAQGADEAVADAALATWGPLRQAELRREQAELRLVFASNQIKPQVDLVVSYSGTGLGYQRSTAQNLALGSRYPDWFVGLNMELPVYGNDRAKAQYLAQAQRRDQAELEIQSIRLAFANDLRSRWLDVRNAMEVLDNSEADYQLRVQIDAVERERYRLGTGSLSAVIQQEAAMIEAGLRRLDSRVRLEVALATWYYLRGELLAQAGITMQ